MWGHCSCPHITPPPPSLSLPLSLTLSPSPLSLARLWHLFMSLQRLESDFLKQPIPHHTHLGPFDSQSKSPFFLLKQKSVQINIKQGVGIPLKLHCFRILLLLLESVEDVMIHSCTTASSLLIQSLFKKKETVWSIIWLQVCGTDCDDYRWS